MNTTTRTSATTTRKGTHDEWQVAERRYLPESSVALFDTSTPPPTQEVAPAQLLTA